MSLRKISVDCVLLWADVQFVKECFAFIFPFLSLPHLIIHLVAFYEYLRSLGHLWGHTVRITRLITLQGKRQFPLVKWYNVKDDFLSENMAEERQNTRCRSELFSAGACVSLSLGCWACLQIYHVKHAMQHVRLGSENKQLILPCLHLQ